jgi:chemotaxis protein histidine kinase CheA
MREFLIDKVLPAMRDAWPAEDAGQTIFVQQDNAKPHILPNDQEFQDAVSKIGMDIQLVQQPANSPDLNVNDLGFFNSIESLTDRRSPRTLNDLIRDVQEEFAAYDAPTLNRIFISLQTCMTEVLNNSGGNGYNIPHVGKLSLEAQNLLPTSIACPAIVYENALKALAKALQADEEAKQEDARKKEQEKKAREEAKQEDARKKEEAKKAREEVKQDEARKKEEAKKAREEAKKSNQSCKRKRAEGKQAQEEQAEGVRKQARAKENQAEITTAEESTSTSKKLLEFVASKQWKQPIGICTY